VAGLSCWPRIHLSGECVVQGADAQPQKKTPEISLRLAEITKHHTAGDPVSGCRWSLKSTYAIARELKRMLIDVSAATVGRLLKAENYSLRKNRKSLETPTGKPPDRKRRNRQFLYIAKQRCHYEQRELPVISLDTKNRELIGQFYQDGRIWSQESTPVFDHDFPSVAKGIGIPHGIYDTIRNEGFVSVGISKDTAQFAVDNLRAWWLQIGQSAYPNATEILLLADCGGSNGYRTRLWKQQLQEQFCNPLGLTVRVCHYPPGASKWNPIEHRLFGFISRNWAGVPLDSYQTMLNFIRTTSTQTGLNVHARLNRKQYQRGIQVCQEQMDRIQLTSHTANPDWNYSIAPATW